MGQAGTVTVSARLALETWSKDKAGAQNSVSFWDMARAGQGTAQFQSNSSSYLRGPAANFVCPSLKCGFGIETPHCKGKWTVLVSRETFRKLL